MPTVDKLPEPDWSILVPTIHSRVRTCFPDLLDVLQDQVGDLPIEVLGLYDSKRRSVGAKRNALLSIARGKFVSFIDDDDLPSPEYVHEIYDAISDHPDADVIVYDHLCAIDGADPYVCKYGVEYEYAHTPGLWTGKPSHTQTWRTGLIRTVPFPELNVGEDMAWVKEAATRVKKQVRLMQTLYLYNCRHDKSETRGAGLTRNVPAAYREWWQAAAR